MNLGLAGWLATVALAGGVDPLLAGLDGADRVTIERGPSSWVIRVDGRSATVSPPVTAEQREVVRALAVCLLADLALVPAVPPVPAADPVALRVLGSLATPEPALPPPARPAAPTPSTPTPTRSRPAAPSEPPARPPQPASATRTTPDPIGVVDPPAEAASVIASSAPIAALDPAPSTAADSPMERVPSPAPPPASPEMASAASPSAPGQPAPTEPAPIAAPPAASADQPPASELATTTTTTTTTTPPTATAPAPTIPAASATTIPATTTSPAPTTASTIPGTTAPPSPAASTAPASSPATSPVGDPPAPSRSAATEPVVEAAATPPAADAPSGGIASLEPPLAPPPADPRRPRPRPRPGPTPPSPLATAEAASAREPAPVRAPGAARWSHGLEIGVRRGLAPAIGPSSELAFGRALGVAVQVATVASRQTEWSSTPVWTASLDAAPALFAQLAVLRIDGGVGVSARTYAHNGAIVAGHLMPVARATATVALPVGPLWLRVGGGPAVDLGTTELTWREDPWTAAGAVAVEPSQARLPGVAWSVRVAIGPHPAPTEAL